MPTGKSEDRDVIRWKNKLKKKKINGIGEKVEKTERNKLNQRDGLEQWVCAAT